MHKDPYSTYSLLREKHPVYQVQPDGVWAISLYHDVHDALLHPEIFSSSHTNEIFQPKWLKGNSIQNYPIAFEDNQKHSHHRNLVTPFFTKSALDSHKPYMYSAAQSLVDRLMKFSSFDFINQFAYYYVDNISGHFLGIKDYDIYSAWRKWMLLVEQPPYCPNDNYLKSLQQSYNKLSNYLLNLIKNAQQTNQNNLIGNIANQQIPHTEINDNTRKNILELLILAGTQLTPHLITQAVIQLIHHSELLNALNDNIEYIDNFVDELLRLYSPIHLIARRTLCTTEVRGVTIPANEPVLLLYSAANRDPDVFENPDEFILKRSNAKPHLSFSYGIHYCLGYMLAKTQLSIAIETLLPEIRKMSCPKRELLDWNYSLLVHKLNSLPVTINKKSR